MRLLSNSQNKRLGAKSPTCVKHRAALTSPLRDAALAAVAAHHQLPHRSTAPQPPLASPWRIALRPRAVKPRGRDVIRGAVVFARAGFAADVVRRRSAERCRRQQAHAAADGRPSRPSPRPGGGGAVAASQLVCVGFRVRQACGSASRETL